MHPNDKYRSMFTDAFMMFAFVLGIFAIICKMIMVAVK